MPSVIRIGARVSAAVGPLPQDQPELGHRKQAIWTGLVVASMPERSWLVLWDPSGQATTHSCRSLKFLEYSNVSEMELQQIQQRFLPSQPEPPAHPESASTNHTAAAVVEQESAPPPLAMVQNVAIAWNNVVEQPPPLAASTSLQQRNDQSDGQPLQLNPLDERQEEDAKQAADPDGNESEELHYDGDNNVFVGLDNYQDGHNEHHQKYFWV